MDNHLLFLKLVQHFMKGPMNPTPTSEPWPFHVVNMHPITLTVSIALGKHNGFWWRKDTDTTGLRVKVPGCEIKGKKWSLVETLPHQWLIELLKCLLHPFTPTSSKGLINNTHTAKHAHTCREFKNPPKISVFGLRVKEEYLEKIHAYTRWASELHTEEFVRMNWEPSLP